MSQKNLGGISRRRSSSLKERLFVNRERKKSQNIRARIQSSGSLRAGSENDLTIAPLNNKYNLVKETSVRIYKLEKNVSRNPWEKLKNSSRFPWSWDTHVLVLGEKELFSTTPTGLFEKPIPYTSIEMWMAVSIPRLPLSYIKVTMQDCSFLIQAPDTYQRDRLLHSVQWKRNICKHLKILHSATNPDLILQELQSLVKNAIAGPICIDDTHHTLLDIISDVLVLNSDTVKSVSNESLIVVLAPLFEQNQPSIEICNFFTKHCRDCPRSRVVIEMFHPVVQRILKYNTNFGKTMWLRSFVKHYFQALNSQNDGESAVRAFVQRVHGPLTVCPHKRILNNLVAVCLSAIYESFAADGSRGVDYEKKKDPFDLPKGSFPRRLSNQRKPLSQSDENMISKLDGANNDLWKAVAKLDKNVTANPKNINRPDNGNKNVNLQELPDNETDGKPFGKDVQDVREDDVETAVLFAQVLEEISSIDDWLPGLAVLLQPVPIQEEPLQNGKFVRHIVSIMERMVQDGREEVIWCLISLRDKKDGWLQVFSPHGNLIEDEGKLFTKMTAVLLESARSLGKTKKVVSLLLNTCLDDVLLLALRESKVMIEVLCSILEYHLVSGRKLVQIVATLRGTALGKVEYGRLCERETLVLQKGGPDEYRLPPRSTDEDLRKFLSNGLTGNLKSLDLSFTQVSCDSAEIISKLPSLQHLNLWSSNIQDVGLRRLCESLNLKSLNLCETNITDDSIECLKDMTNLTDLNLNSTPVSSSVYELLCSSLPNLTVFDITYTEAWPGNSRAYGDTNNALPSTKGPADRLKLDYKQNV